MHIDMHVYNKEQQEHRGGLREEGQPRDQDRGPHEDHREPHGRARRDNEGIKHMYIYIYICIYIYIYIYREREIINTNI